MQPSLTLYHYWRSSCSWRVRWVLALKSITYESVAVNLLESEQKKAEYLALNPNGLVPALQVDGQFLTESLAIIEWLDEVFPENPVLPKDPWIRAQAREIALLIAAGIQPLQNLKVTHHFSDEAKEREHWSRYFIEAGFTALEKKLAAYSGDYCLGHSLTLADIFLVPQIYNALRFQVEMHRFPRLESIYKNCLRTEACDKASPHRQPGAHP